MSGTKSHIAPTGGTDKPTQVKVHRYFAGKAPKWVEQDEDEYAGVFSNKTGPIEKASKGPGMRFSKGAGGADSSYAEIVKKADSRRPRQEAAEPEPRSVQRREGQILAGSDAEESEEEDEDEIERRRARARARAQEREEEELLAVEDGDESKEGEEEEEDDDDEEESEYETDSEEESDAPQMLKPVFTTKSARQTILEREKEEAEAARREEERMKKIEEKKMESKKMVEQELQRELEQSNKKDDAGSDDDHFEMPSDKVEDEAAEYAAWRIREVARVKREREERELLRREREEIERQRNMTVEERAAEDRRLEALAREKAKKAKEDAGKMKYMQKYYHKGAFFSDDQETSDLFKRNYSTAATGDDTWINKESLPKVMQVKNFGRSGQTKYTHLADQDTTDRSAPWAQKDGIRSKYTEKMAGMGKELDPNLRKEYRQRERGQQERERS